MRNVHVSTTFIITRWWCHNNAFSK